MHIEMLVCAPASEKVLSVPVYYSDFEKYKLTVAFVYNSSSIYLQTDLTFY